MKSNHGITLPLLLLTVVILSIIATATIYTGTNVIEFMKKNEFVTQMKLVKEKVDILSEEVSEGISNINAGVDLQSTDSEIQSKIVNIFSKYSVPATEQSNYLYFDPTNLEKLGIFEVPQKVIINFATKSVYSIDGITIKGIQYNELSEVQALEK